MKMIKIKKNEKKIRRKYNEWRRKRKLWYKLYTDQNPFKKTLIRGATEYGIGNTAMIGSFAAYIMFDTVTVTSVLAYYGGDILSVVGYYVTLRSLLGFGFYKLYQMN